jgi:hypothetical protein
LSSWRILGGQKNIFRIIKLTFEKVKKVRKKHYVYCRCGARMRRTGRKVEETSIGGWPFYLREYECPRCGRKWVYSECRNIQSEYYDERIFE